MRYATLLLLLSTTLAACEPVCGNGELEENEDCDSGDTADNDGCSSSCLFERCGDGILQEGEACDDGNNLADDGCDPLCLNFVCGDGILQPDEGCDDGNATNGDGCAADCRIEFCGDGVAQPNEQCDDGNFVSGDSCNDDCKVPCGGEFNAKGAALDPISGDCYAAFLEEDILWADAEARCESFGGHLAAPKNAQENNLTFIATDNGQISDSWLGFHDLGAEAITDPSAFQRVTGGTTALFSNFADEQPDNATLNSPFGQNCSRFNSGTQLDKWNDAECDQFLGKFFLPDSYLCTLEATPCGDGVTQVVLGEECDDGNNTPGDGCDALCHTELCGAGTGAAGRAQDPANDHCYLSFQEAATWQEAEQRCEEIGGYLAVIESPEENTLARSASRIFEGPWIGLSDLASDAGIDPALFSTSKGDLIGVGFHGFAPGEPSNNSGTNNDCVQLLRADLNQDPLSWGDTECTNVAQHFLCEVEPNHCGDRVIQSTLGETCDDGNITNNDGCSAGCLIE